MYFLVFTKFFLALSFIYETVGNQVCRIADNFINNNNNKKQNIICSAII